MKKTLINLKVLSLLMTGVINFSAIAKTKKSWVYFDLGDTIIDTKKPDGIDYFSGSKEYIKSLKDKGFKIGIISNIPESFGMDYPEKLKTLKKYIKENWAGETKFNWELFDQIFLPLSNEQLKPADIMYNKAMESANYCPMAYISENEIEVEKAQMMGIAGHLFDKFNPEVYVPIEEMDRFLDENYTNPVPEDCL